MPPNQQPVTLCPQPGPQSLFLGTTADIAIYGGAAGGGKSYALLLEPLRHYNNPLFSAVIFRRNAFAIRSPGGLWDESVKVYGPLGAHPSRSFLSWTFPPGMWLKFAHLENDMSVLDWQGAQIPLIGYDELTHFTEQQFWYMLSRNRSVSGVPGYVRATTNPDAASWVLNLIDWWISPEGYPIKERSGVIRWFLRIDGKLVWGDSRQALIDKYGADELPKSLTFIASSIYDNEILMKSDPSYLASLKALTAVDRARLLGGNWRIRLTAGTLFKRQWFEILPVLPKSYVRTVRFWDRAATKHNPAISGHDPDWTRGVKMHLYPNGTYVISDVASIRDTPGKVEQFMKATAAMDGFDCEIKCQVDPGSAGKSEAEYFLKSFSGYIVSVETMTQNKTTRAKPLSAQAEAGNIFLIQGPWLEDFINEAESFPDGTHDDQIDGASGAFNELASVQTF